MGRMEKYKPAVPRKVLYIFAGLLWTIAGIILCQFSLRWLIVVEWIPGIGFGLSGLFLAIFFYQKGFKSVVRKNLERLHSLPERPCLFAFAGWNSYLVIAAMMTMGMMLRHSAIPKLYLAVPYEAMGGALLIGSVQYYLSPKR